MVPEKYLTAMLKKMCELKFYLDINLEYTNVLKRRTFNKLNRLKIVSITNLEEFCYFNDIISKLTYMFRLVSFVNIEIT